MLSAEARSTFAGILSRLGTLEEKADHVRRVLFESPTGIKEQIETLFNEISTNKQIISIADLEALSAATPSPISRVDLAILMKSYARVEDRLSLKEFTRLVVPPSYSQGELRKSDAKREQKELLCELIKAELLFEKERMWSFRSLIEDFDFTTLEAWKIMDVRKTGHLTTADLSKFMDSYGFSVSISSIRALIRRITMDLSKAHIEYKDLNSFILSGTPPDTPKNREVSFEKRERPAVPKLSVTPKRTSVTRANQMYLNSVKKTQDPAATTHMNNFMSRKKDPETYASQKRGASPSQTLPRTVSRGKRDNSETRGRLDATPPSARRVSVVRTYSKMMATPPRTGRSVEQSRGTKSGYQTPEKQTLRPSQQRNLPELSVEVKNLVRLHEALEISKAELIQNDEFSVVQVFEDLKGGGHNDTILIADFDKGLRKYSVYPTFEQIQNLFKNHNIDSKKGMDLQEFLVLLLPLSGRNAKKLMENTKKGKRKEEMTDRRKVNEIIGKFFRALLQYERTLFAIKQSISRGKSSEKALQMVFEESVDKSKLTRSEFLSLFSSDV
eukprot:TRINITY_DN4146_c0_g1_i2.p1 TRINITY_DN4146_c0_g1~~TRINITY_DN4146_c0_g1_i2.p1  ORF type:complete len:557 (-),score=88.22 TRINITY_DN4146_c0_g1_i2:135-1805(-)